MSAKRQQEGDTLQYCEISTGGEKAARFILPVIKRFLVI